MLPKFRDPLIQRLAQAKWAISGVDCFLGYLISELPSFIIVDPAHPIKTAATNYTAYYYNESFCQKLTDEELIFVVIHEALHVLFAHGLRRGARYPELWNIAADHAINLLIQANFGLAPRQTPKPPQIATMPLNRELNPPEPIGCMDTSFRNMTAEEIYDGLLKDCRTLKIDLADIAHSLTQQSPTTQRRLRSFDPESGKVNPEEQKIKQAVGEALSRALARAVGQRHRRAQGNEPSLFERMALDSFTPETPWEQLLRAKLTCLGIDNADWSRPHKKYLGIKVAGYPLYLPRRTGVDYGHIAVIIDTSGSIQEEELGKFITEINHLLNRGNVTVHLFTCDTEPHFLGRFTSSRKLDAARLELPGGGGTDFRPAFAAATAIHRRHALTALVYLTDTYGSFPEEAPGYPCIWIIPENPDATVPFGTPVHVNLVKQA